MNKKEIVKQLNERHKQCVVMMLSIKDKEVKSEYYGEMVGIEYAIGLLLLED